MLTSGLPSDSYRTRGLQGENWRLSRLHAFGINRLDAFHIRTEEVMLDGSKCVR